MILRTLSLTLTLIFFLCTNCSDDNSPDPPENTPFETTYTVIYQGNFSKFNFPNSFPANDHFSTAIGMAHNDQIQLFQPGSLASHGIKNMAELGLISPLDDEIQAQADAGNALEVIRGKGLNDGTTSDTFTITINQDFPLISLVSMIAPSPDWFVAVRNVALFENGNWKEDLEVATEAYDAGTDKGSTYNDDNDQQIPPAPIKKITDPPLGDGTGVSPAVAFFRFVRS